MAKEWQGFCASPSGSSDYVEGGMMDIQKEKNAFLGVYVCYQGDSRKIQFNEETEQFMWRKNNVSDSEVEYVHLMNQRWYAWLACAKSKANAVPDGYVLVPKEPTEKMIMNGLLVISTEIGKYDIQKEVGMIWEKMIEAQEQSHD
jgi:hypothetical protein